MSRKRIQLASLLLVTGRAILFSSIFLAAILLWWNRPQPPVIESAAVAQTAQAMPQPVSHALEWYSPLWTRDLKQELRGEGTDEPLAVVPDIAAPRLISTCIAPEGSFAHLLDHTGEMRLKSVDEQIDGYQVVAIEQGRVQLKKHRQALWIELPKSGENGR